MMQALIEAQKAYALDEVPIGAVVVYNGKIIANAHNLREHNNDPTAHAEIIALREAARYLGGWRLFDCDLYVTVEPCPMCAGAIVQARIKTLVYGAKDAKAGCCGSVYDLVNNDNFNHRVEVINGIMEEECVLLMKNYFREKRCK